MPGHTTASLGGDDGSHAVNHGTSQIAHARARRCGRRDIERCPVRRDVGSAPGGLRRRCRRHGHRRRRGVRGLDDGVDADAVADAVAASGGSLDRARRLAGPYRDLRRLALDLPARLRPYGASAGRLSAEITDAVDAAVDGLGEQHAGQIAKLRTDIEAAGYPPRVAATMERSLENRQKRLVTQARIEALGEVFAGVLASVSNRLANGEISPEIADGWFSSTEQTQRVFTETPSVRTSLMLDAWLLRCPPLG